MTPDVKYMNLAESIILALKEYDRVHATYYAYYLNDDYGQTALAQQLVDILPNYTPQQ